MFQGHAEGFPRRNAKTNSEERRVASESVDEFWLTLSVSFSSLHNRIAVEQKMSLITQGRLSANLGLCGGTPLALIPKIRGNFLHPIRVCRVSYFQKQFCNSSSPTIPCITNL